MPTKSGRSRSSALPRVETQHTAVGRLVMLHRWLSADDRRRLLEQLPELAATLAHLDRCEAQIAVLTVGTRSRDVGLGEASTRSAPRSRWWSDLRAFDAMFATDAAERGYRSAVAAESQAVVRRLRRARGVALHEPKGTSGATQAPTRGVP